MISKTKFRQLSITQKGEYVFQEGDYIGLREYYNHRINLYSLFDFFVEVWYFPVENKIVKGKKNEISKGVESNPCGSGCDNDCGAEDGEKNA
jgi:hypothetical protein